MAGTLAHRAARQSFARGTGASSQSLPLGVGDAESMLKADMAAMKARMKTAARQVSTAQKRKAEEHRRRDECLQALSSDEVLRSRNLLAQCGDWVAAPHSCPCLILPTSATQAARQASDIGKKFRLPSLDASLLCSVLN